ncbi:MAG: hypothetical protein Q4B75_09880 [Eubacteriales bacterium]|nr:hypothetical protein [Eubacteriales bacterium]
MVMSFAGVALVIVSVSMLFLKEISFLKGRQEGKRDAGKTFVLFHATIINKNMIILQSQVGGCGCYQSLQYSYKS